MSVLFVRSRISAWSGTKFCIPCLVLIPTWISAQSVDYEATWPSLRQHQTPEWFKDAKFGISNLRLLGRTLQPKYKKTPTSILVIFRNEKIGEYAFVLK
ncbi:alpha-L-fucosidase [Maribacter sp.]